MNEAPHMMVIHGALAGIVAYIAMVYILKQPSSVAEYRSVLLAAISIIYMVIFGHKLPF
tara:strand:- start:312 stop:488 length:177 start_codon:yes stop_codon:yes gene_type:complete